MIKMNKRVIALYTISLLLLASLIYVSATTTSSTAFSYTEETLVVNKNQIIGGNFIPAQANYVLLSAVYDPITGLIYATNYYNGTLVIFDPNNNTIIGCIVVGPYPVSVAVDTQNGVLYVVSNSTASGSPNGSLFVVNPISKSVVSTIPLGKPAYEVVVNPNNGYVYVAEPYSVVIFNQGTEISKINLTNEVSDMIYDPYTGYVVVSTKSYIFALSGVKVVANYSLTNNNGYSVLTVNPIDGYIYGATYGNFTVYNPTTLSPITSFNELVITPPVNAMVYDPTNGVIYLACTDDIGELNASNPQMVEFIYQPIKSVIHSFVYDPVNGNVYAIAESPTPIYLIKNDVALILCDIRLTGSVYDPITGYVYTTNECSNTLYVIGNEGVVKTLSTVYYPYAITYNPTNGYLYIISYYNDTVSEVNPYTGQVIWSAHVGCYPRSLLYDPYNGYLYVVNCGSDSVTVVNANNGTEIANVPAYSLPTSITLDPQNGLVYVADYSGNLTVINGTQVIANVKLGFNATAITYINNYLYIGGPGGIEVMDPSDYKVIQNISIPYYPQDIVYNNKDNSIYVVMLGPIPNSTDGCLLILNPITLQTSYTAKLGIWPTSVSVNQSNGAVYVTNLVSGTINIIIPIVQSPTTTSSTSTSSTSSSSTTSSISITSSTSTVTSTSTTTSSSNTSTITTTSTVYSSTVQSSYTQSTSSLSTPSTPVMPSNNSGGILVISSSTLTSMLILIMLILSVIVAIIVIRK